LNEEGMLFHVHSVSPDGNFIAGNRRESISGNYVGMIVFSVIKQTYTKLSDTGQGPIWFQDNKRILYIDSNTLYVMNIRTGNRHQVLNSPPILTDWAYYTFSPDNKSIYFIKEEKESDIWLGYLQ
jgi:hypothetical protein